jgi:hypothetical protein
MYIEQAFKGLHESWKYVVGFIVVFVIATQIIGAMPLMGAIAYKTLETGNMIDMSDMSNVYNLFDSNTTLLLILIPFVVGFVALFLWVKFLHKLDFKSLTTSRIKIDWKRVFFSFLLWGGITVFMIVLDYQLSPDNYQWNFEFNKFIVLVIIAVLLVPIQTSFEEYLFRGYLMQGIGIAAKNKWVPLLVTSFIFGMMHIANPEVAKIGYIIMVYYIGTGLFLGILTLMDEGMELALGFHAANNLITALLVTANWTAFQTDSILKDMSEPTAGVDVLIPVIVVFPILLFIFSKKYQWSDWKEKLTGNVLPPNNSDLEI